MNKKIIAGAGAAAAILGIAVAATASNGGHGNPAPPASSPAAAVTPAVQVQSPTPSAPPPPQFTAAEQQVIDSAKGYLSDGEGFSKAGLLQQLTSSYGDGYSRKLALFALRHIRVNWYHQALLAARNYLSDGEGFSYSGLVQQLSSAYGDQFTYAQAVYAAHKAGL